MSFAAMTLAAHTSSPKTLARLRRAGVLCMAAFGIAACSQGNPPVASSSDAVPAPAASVSRVAGDLDTYRKLVGANNDEMVVTMGHDILDRYPGSDAAKEVQQSLPAIEQRYKDSKEKTRLAALWYYQTAPMAGGIQSTATLYSGQPSGNDRVRLVLRRHTSWGQSVYLYGSGHGFVCHGNCAMAGTVDGKPIHITVFAPPTGEPALMVRDDKAFLGMLRKAKKITLDVTLVDGTRTETLTYEVGGFDPDKWAPLPKQKKS